MLLAKILDNKEMLTKRRAAVVNERYSLEIPSLKRGTDIALICVSQS